MKYQEIRVMDLPDGFRVQWIDLEELIDDVPGKAVVVKSDTEIIIVDVCDVDEYEAGRGIHRFDRFEMCEQVAEMANEKTKEIVGSPVVRVPDSVIVDSIEDLVSAISEYQNNGCGGYNLTVNGTKISKNLRRQA